MSIRVQHRALTERTIIDAVIALVDEARIAARTATKSRRRGR
jgi:hypothetical protein